MTHLRLLRDPAFYGWHLEQALARDWRVIRYDMRGTGLSERGRSEFSSPHLTGDISAVADSLGLGRFTLLSAGMHEREAVVYASENSDRLEHLVMLLPSPPGPIVVPGEQSVEGAAALRDVSWELFISSFHRMRGIEGDAAQAGERMLREGWTEPAYRSFMETREIDDWTDRISDVTAPISVLQFPLAMEQVDEMFPKARVHAIEGSPTTGDAEGGTLLANSVASFMSTILPEHDSTAAAAPAAPGGFQTILFTDLESSTALTQRVGDEAAQEVLRGHNSAVRSALEAHDGREVKHTGDGIMASFSSAVSAVQASLAIQLELDGSEVRVRIGINAGEPIAEDDDLFGTAVQLAARITDRAEPQQVLVSRVVMDLCAGKTFKFTSAGDATLKGFDEPVALYQVRPG